jgi:hypothetical protein
MRPRLAVTVAVFASLTLLASACTTAPGATSTPTTSPPSAIQVLGDAATKSKGQSFTYTLTYGNQLKADGAQDSSGSSGTRNVTYTDAASGLVLKASLVLAGSALYAKVDLGAAALLVPGLAGIGNKYLTLDRTKIGTSGIAAGLVPSADSIAPDTYLTGVTEAEIVSPTQIKGKIDLTKGAPKVLPATEIAKLDATAKVVPFVADLDSQGRIAKLDLTLPQISTLPAAELVVNYAAYGSAVTVTAPAAADTVPAPDLIYNFLQ